MFGFLQNRRSLLSFLLLVTGPPWTTGHVFIFPLLSGRIDFWIEVRHRLVGAGCERSD